MTAALERVVEWFVAPAGAQRRPAPAVPAPRAATAVPSAVGLLAAPRDLDALAGALALRLVARSSADCAVVYRWCARNVSAESFLAHPSASRTARVLAEDGLAARATGRLVVVALAPDPVDARAGAERGMTLAGDLPGVLALEARATELDALLSGRQRIVVAPPPAASVQLRALAVQDAARIAQATGAIEVPAIAPPARALAAAGLLVTAGLRHAVDRGLDEPA